VIWDISGPWLVVLPLRQGMRDVCLDRVVAEEVMSQAYEMALVEYKSRSALEDP
jgi:hypothetical protein